MKITNKGQRSRALIPVAGAYVAYPAPDPIREPEPRRTPPRPGHGIEDGQHFSWITRLVGPHDAYQREVAYPGIFKPVA